MNCPSLQFPYPAGRSAGFFYGLPVDEPVDDYMTDVDACWELFDKLHSYPMWHSDNAAIFYTAASMPRLQHLDQTWQDTRNLSVYESMQLESLLWPTSCLTLAPTYLPSGLIRNKDTGHMTEMDWMTADDEMEDVYIIDAVDEMDIVVDINAA
ncbi:hypothetical protein ACQKWADRAFT_286425 [Trichoderma austrokoningii]